MPGFPLLRNHGSALRPIRLRLTIAVALVSLHSAASASTQTATLRFKVVAIAEKGGIHKPFVDAAKVWLAREARVDGFTIDYIDDTSKIDDAFLSQYKLFIQLNYPPYAWTPTAMAAFQRYIEEGRGGWIGYPMWPWFSSFMGGIRFAKYIPTFVNGAVTVEAPDHPVMKDLPSHIAIESEEWYTYDKSPRPNVRVLASVDENSYSPASAITMGDHPVVWTNQRVKARNVYIFMGHHGELFQNSGFTTLFHNSILWAAQP